MLRMFSSWMWISLPFPRFSVDPIHPFCTKRRSTWNIAYSYLFTLPLLVLRVFRTTLDCQKLYPILLREETSEDLESTANIPNNIHSIFPPHRLFQNLISHHNRMKELANHNSREFGHIHGDLNHIFYQSPLLPLFKRVKRVEEAISRTLHPSHNLFTDDLVFIPLVRSTDATPLTAPNEASDFRNFDKTPLFPLAEATFRVQARWLNLWEQLVPYVVRWKEKVDRRSKCDETRERSASMALAVI